MDFNLKKIPEYTPIGHSLYSLMAEKAKSNLNKPALSYFDEEITFCSLLNRIDKAAKGLTKMGIGKGDVVIVSLPSIPQAVELFYAVNMIGAIYCGMDCRSTSDEIKEIFTQVKPKACFVADFHLNQFLDIDDVPVICISFIKTISIIASFASFFVELFTGRSFYMMKKKNFFRYKTFIKNGNDEPLHYVKSNNNDVCAYFYTSGTTYGRKCVVLTNENMNSSVIQYAYSQPGADETDRYCTIMPLFTCYGITLGTHLPLILGKQVRLIPLFMGRNMKKLLIKERPGYISTVPAHWEHFVKDDFTRVDLSFFKGAIVGGDKLSHDYEDKINSILKKCGSKGKVMRGYGLTEASTVVTVQLKSTPTGSVGSNMCWSKIGIFEYGTDKELPNNSLGEICVSGPNVCQGYLGDEQATNSLLKLHSDGQIWLHSGDTGYFDDNHNLYFNERIKRMFVRYDGTKVSPYGIEQQIYKCNVVSGCLVYSVDDTEHKHGKCPHALVVFKDTVNIDQAKKELKKHIKTNIPSYMRPVKTHIVEALPVTKNGKFDYFNAKMSQLTESELLNTL